MITNPIHEQTLNIIRQTVPNIYAPLKKFYSSPKAQNEYRTISYGLDNKKNDVIKLKDVSIKKFVQSVLANIPIAQGTMIYINPQNRLAFIDYTSVDKKVPRELRTQTGTVFDAIQSSITNLVKLMNLLKLPINYRD